jgi:hypothetical protein
MKQNNPTIKIIEEDVGIWAITTEEAMERVNKLISELQEEYDSVRVINIQKGKEDFNDHRKHDYTAFIELITYNKKLI